MITRGTPAARQKDSVGQFCFRGAGRPSRWVVGSSRRKNVPVGGPSRVALPSTFAEVPAKRSNAARPARVIGLVPMWMCQVGLSA